MKLRLAFALGLVAMIVTTLTFSFALANPPRQGGDFIPTPTVYPSGEATYEVTVVGGEDTPQIFERGGYDNFTVYETQLVSLYPRGMEFSVTAESSAGEVDEVRLNILYKDGRDNIKSAEQDAEGVWTVNPWEDGDGIPAWIPFEFQWLVRDTSGTEIRTTPVSAVYWDPTREWTRIEFETFIVYTYNFEQVYSLEDFAQRLYTAVESTEPRRVEGFGGKLSYKPLAILYSSEADFAETYDQGLRSETLGGFTNNLWGSTVQYFNADADYPVFSSGNSSDPVWGDCVWIDPSFNPAVSENNGRRANEVSLDFAIYQTVPHEFAHLYQYEFEVRNEGFVFPPSWWIEGQAEYFGYSTGVTFPADQRLRYLATLDPKLTDIEGDNISRELKMEDGCLYMVYSVGHSFVNWFISTYGIELHAELMRLQFEEEMEIFPAMEQLTGEDFLDIQNAWRAYIGFDLLTLAEVDPASALEAPIDALYAEGDSVTLGATPIQNPIYEVPGENKIANGSCFANTKIIILRVGSLNGINYYEVDCQGQKGWMKESQLPIKP